LSPHRNGNCAHESGDSAGHRSRDGEWSVPAGWSVEEFRRIAEMDISARRQDDVDLIKRLCDGWLRDEWHNQPIRGCGIWASPSSDSPLANTDRLCEIGHRWYSDAKSAWTALSA
jgi:hypothetical protein